MAFQKDRSKLATFESWWANECEHLLTVRLPRELRLWLVSRGVPAATARAVTEKVLSVLVGEIGPAMAGVDLEGASKTVADEILATYRRLQEAAGVLGAHVEEGAENE